MLSDVDIFKMMKSKDIMITNFDRCSLTGVGYDLRLGDCGYSFTTKRKYDIKKNRAIKLIPHESVVVTTIEGIFLSKRVSGTVHSQVKRMQNGLQAISTTIDPDWEGKPLIHLTNNFNIPIKIHYSDTICTVCFYSLNTPTTSRCIEPHVKRMDLNTMEKIADEHELQTQKSIFHLLKSKPALFIYLIVIDIMVLHILYLFKIADVGSMTVIMALTMIGTTIIEIIKSK